MENMFSFEVAPLVMNQDAYSDVSPDEIDSDPDGSGGSSDHPGNPGITSRLSMLKIDAVISKFSEFKKSLVTEIGFGGLLLIKSWQKINLKYSAYLMDRVDVEQSIINLEAQGMLELSAKQVHSVFAIPNGLQLVFAEAADPSEACIEYTKIAAGISDKGTHSLKAAEAVLLRKLTEDSSNIESQCFKIAFVIFVVGHVLAPSSKHEYITIDFWGAMNDVTKIKDWNWCAYLLKHLFRGVRKFKKDVNKRNPTIHIVGCHLFLQVLALDSLDLGSLNKPMGMYPRIALFDYESMKKMVDAISVNMGAGEISYHGASVRLEENISKDIVWAASGTHKSSSARPSLSTKRVQLPPAPTLRTSYNKPGPQDFSNHIRAKYPSISSEKLGILLREQNARGLAIITEMRQSFQSSMFTFVDKLVSVMEENCTCCKANGRQHCILNSSVENCETQSNLGNHAADCFETPVSNKIATRLGAAFDHEAAGSSSANSSLTRKRGSAHKPRVGLI